jgi:hypothetical protein
MHENSDLYGNPDLLELSLEGQRLLIQEIRADLVRVCRGLWRSVRHKVASPAAAVFGSAYRRESILPRR